MRTAVTLALTMVPLALAAQDPEGILNINPTGQVAAKIHYSGQQHYHLRPFNPFLEKEVVALTADSSTALGEQRFRYQLTPVLDASAGASAYPEMGYAAVGSAGVHGQVFIGDRWYLRGGYQMGFLHFPDHLEVRNTRTGSIDGFGRSFDFMGGNAAHYLTGAAGMRIGQHFSLEAGREKHFWGDGYRSMVLSHAGAPYTYARLTTKVWKIKYINLWARMNDHNLQTGERRHKFTAMHALSWNITPKFNLSIYEAIVWQAEDNLVNRGFDIAYLNPFILYRPIEFAKGSADNVLLGASMSLDVHRSARIYGQLYFDEFVISELRSSNQWWGNKFAIQLGIKAWDLFEKGHSLLTELNLARPFMYTHGSVIQAYAHDNIALAHPLGSNLGEWITRYGIQRDHFEFTATFSLASFALDPAGKNFGNDILRSYRGPTRIYGNEWFQGDRQNLLYTELDLAVPSGLPGIRLFANTGYRRLSNNEASPNDFWLMAGLRTAIVRPYRDF